MTISTRASGLTDPVSARLLTSSARHSYDPDVDLDWEAPFVEGKWFMQPERMSLYGTRTWDRLSEEQLIELSKHEVASIMSVGLWFEIVLMELMLRDIYDADPRADRTHYMLTEIADECRHSTMFGKAIERLGVPAYGPQRRVHVMGRVMKAIGSGVSAYAGILVAEDILDRWQRELIKDERCQPMSRMVCRIHVLEEARHMTFAKEEIERQRPRLSGVRLAYHQAMLAQSVFAVSRSLVNAEAYAAVGLDPDAARREALGNPHYQATLAWMGERVVPFLQEQDLIPQRHRQTWERSYLLPKA
ncbi:AurF N-oxygenase family protein [Luteipulveratus mongoliensis]|uniref:Membrane protein n=1 Tax=Luteipulveratus mongoliensis TaxID=571913 RepID=A0A0K1JHY5_9MICO|nr:diiron oxygenase [Luteipulveratus mongoliensis]AKU16316.1 membrane protein [Luteipulveratus mongoliensis]